VRRPGGGGDKAEEPAAEAPTATLPTNEEDARLERLERLGSLREKGILTEEEFAAEKARLLGGGSSGS
jgi:Short C-terminal domain